MRLRKKAHQCETHTHIPPLPRSLASVALNRQLDRRVCGQRREWRRSGRLPAGAGSLPLLQSVSMVYVLFVAEVFFPVLILYSPRSIVWGLFLFSSPSSCYAVFFFFNSLSSCSVYPLVIYVCCVCMDRLMANFTGTCD